MSRCAELETAKTECAALVNAFAYLVDHRRYDEIITLFDADGVFERPGARAEGHDQIRQFLNARPSTVKTRHVCAPPFFEEIGEETARTITYVTMFHGEGADTEAVTIHGIAGLVEFHHRFRRTGDGWRIAHHESRIAMLVKH